MVECKQLGKVAVSRIELPTPFPVGPVNTYLLQQEDVNVLVDCGPKTNEAQQSLLAGLGNLGLQPQDITAVVLTHGHVDHVGLCGFLQAQGALVCAHPGVQTWLSPGGRWDEYRKDFYSRYYAEMGMTKEDMERAFHELSLFAHWNDRSVVNEFLREGDVLPFLPNFEVVEVPGHAQAAIALWDRDSGELVVGDQLLPHISSNAFVEPVMTAARGREADYTHSLLDYRKNLQYLATLPVKKVYPGHGDPFTDAGALIAKRFHSQARRREEILTLLRQRPMATAYDIAAIYFAHRNNQPTLILSETLGYLDLLQTEGSARSVRTEDGKIHWEALL